MTNQEAMKLALEALKTVYWHGGGSCWIVDAEQLEAAEKSLEEALAEQEPDDLMIAYMSGLHDGKKLAKKEQSEPVAIIHRNEYNEYRLEPHDSFDIKSIPFNVDVLLFKGKNNA